MTIGFEGLAVTTVAPAIAGDLQGIHLFGWIFSAYLLAQIVGTLVIGRQIDRKGPALLFTIAIILFAVGLIVAAVANNMYVLIGSRALQGFGAGAMYTCIYTAISLSYPDELRAKILGALGTAYVLPSMLGPYVAGVIAQQLSWRFVFLGGSSFLASGGAPQSARLPKIETAERSGEKGRRRRHRIVRASRDRYGAFLERSWHGHQNMGNCASDCRRGSYGTAPSQAASGRDVVISSRFIVPHRFARIIFRRLCVHAEFSGACLDGYERIGGRQSRAYLGQCCA
ncbi:MFS transporter [Paenibacillus sp. DMB20]|uniref:MFS transporter n=1 Tax=Paenibacillus sp. DMB20 TaxID=1642570 RepID=UPI003FA592A8